MTARPRSWPIDRATFLAGSAGFTASLAGIARAEAMQPGAVALPLEVVNNRPFVGLTYGGPARRVWARTWIDTGGGALIVTAPLLREIGLPPPQSTATFEKCAWPGVRAGALAARTDRLPSFATQTANVTEGGESQAFTSPVIFDRVRLDYPARTFVVNDELRGTSVAATISDRSFFPRVEVTIGGRKFGMLLDTGTSCTMLSAAVIAELGGRWPARRAAYGYANMGADYDVRATIARIPSMEFAGMTLRDVLCVSRPRGTFEEYMSNLMDGAIVGALGGNVLRNFVVEIDYAGKKVAISGRSAPEPPLVQVPVVVEALPQHHYRIIGVAETLVSAGGAVPRAGDLLEAIDGKATHQLSFPAVLEALRGKPGDAKTLALRRGDDALELVVAVQTII